MLARLLFNNETHELHTARLTTGHKVAAVALGASVGFVLGVTSAGSGSLIAVGLIMIFRLTPRRVVGTDVFHAAVLLWAAAIAHVIAGNVDFALAGTILIGSIPGVWIGSGLAVRLPVGVMRATLAVVLLAAGLALLQKANVGIPSLVILGVPIVIGGGAALVGFLRNRPIALPEKA